MSVDTRNGVLVCDFRQKRSKPVRAKPPGHAKPLRSTAPAFHSYESHKKCSIQSCPKKWQNAAITPCTLRFHRGHYPVIPVPVNIAVDSPKGAVSFQCQLRFNRKDSPVLFNNQSDYVPSANESASLKILQQAPKLKSAL